MSFIRTCRLIVCGVILLSSFRLAAQPAPSDQGRKHVRLVNAATTRCIACHGKLLQGRQSIHSPASEGCVDCHAFAVTETGTSVSLSAPEPGICLGCHDVSNHRKTPGRDVATQACSACHDPHGTSTPHLLRQGRTSGSPVPTAPGPAAVPPGPGPSPARSPSPAPPTSAPAEAVSPVPAPPRAAESWAKGRGLLTAGSYAEAARAFRAGLEAEKEGFTVQLFVACSEETVLRAVAGASAKELYIRAVRYQGKDCWSLGWGVYGSEALARAATGGVPAALLDGGVTPKVTPVARVLR
jgi:predicted CXXCH cytochrome family protein